MVSVNGRLRGSYLAALDELLLSCLVLVGGGGVLGGSDGLSGSGSRVFGCTLKEKV